MEQQKFEQSCAINFCVKLGESATMTYEKLQRAYGEHSLSRTQVFRCHKSFLEGREQVEDESRAGRPSTSKMDDSVERVRSLVMSNCRLTLRIISSELNLNRFTVHQILTQDLDMRNCAPRWFQILSRLSIRPIGRICVLIFWTALRGNQNSSVALSRMMNHGFWSMTRYKTPKSGVPHRKLSPSKESENEQIQNQIDAHLFSFESQGIVDKDFVPPGQTVKLFMGSPWKTQEKGGTCATRHCTHLGAAPR